MGLTGSGYGKVRWAFTGHGCPLSFQQAKEGQHQPGTLCTLVGD